MICDNCTLINFIGLLKNPDTASCMYTAILRKVVGKSARDNPVWVILSALFFKEI